MPVFLFFCGRRLLFFVVLWVVNCRWISGAELQPCEDMGLLTSFLSFSVILGLVFGLYLWLLVWFEINWIETKSCVYKNMQNFLKRYEFTFPEVVRGRFGFGADEACFNP